MVKSFNIARTPSLLFGENEASKLPSLIASFGKKALFITGKKSFSSHHLWADIQAQCENSHIEIRNGVVESEPTPQLIDGIVREFSVWKPEVIIAIGGGSVIDAGKAVSAMLCQDGKITDFLEGIGSKQPTERKIPFIAVPTTAGTGAEATKNAVISEVGENGFKRSLRHNNYVPDIALIDPLLSVSCPKVVTARSGMDAFTQLLESYLSIQASPYTDALAVDGIRHVRNGLREAFHHGENAQARGSMAYAAYLSGITLANAGLGTVHGYASSIGGYFEIPHGLICARMMGPVNKLTVKKLRGISEVHGSLLKYARIGKLFSTDKNRSDQYYTDLLLDIIDQWTDEFAISRLSQYGVSRADFARIVAQTSNKNNPISLSADDLTEALELAF